MDFDLIDDYVRVTDKDTMLMTRRLAKEEGFFVGQTSGMAVHGAVQWMEANRPKLDTESVVVILLPDTGFRYLSKTYDDSWMRSHGFLENTPGMSIAEIMKSLPNMATVVSVSPDDTLGAAADRMTANGISQLPVTTDSGVVGSLTDSDVLIHLMDNPDARNELVATAMGAPPQVVPQSMQLQPLVGLLSKAPGAVLVAREMDNTYDIITKSDLIGILSQRVLSGQNGMES